jgi:hypothetical protein
MDEDCLWSAGCCIVAVSCGQRDDFVQTKDRPGDRVPELIELRKRFLDGEGVSTRVQEQALHALGHEGLHISLGRFHSTVSDRQRSRLGVFD